ncbi:MAG: branched-chain amino acid aminotransferase [Myxococcaceae bacterium]
MPLDISITRSKQLRPKPPASDLGFGRFFTDHMFVADYESGGWSNGRVVPYGALPLDPAAAVLHYGQALFEGMKAYRAQSGRALVFRPELHAARLNVSAERLCMPALPEEDFHRALRALLDVDREWIPAAPGTALYLRPAMIATEAFLGVRPARRYSFFIIASPVGNYWGPKPSALRLWVETKAVRAAKGGIGAAKAGANYVASLLTAEQAKAQGYSQVLWLDSSHTHVEEVGTMNVFFRFGDTVVTPPLDGSFLAGVTRDTVLRLLRRWKVPVEERPVAMAEVAEAYDKGELKEVFGTGTAAVVSPVSELTWGKRSLRLSEQRGAVAERAFQAMTELTQSGKPDAEGWLVEM